MSAPSTPGSKMERTTPVSTPGGTGKVAKEEKIVVTVRLRPLSRREQLARDHVAWECIDDHTIVYKPQPHDRSALQASFTFDQVFGPSSITEFVYEEGVKNVALSALMGINATIFAYGQTSSGKTYTMRGIMEKAVNDIYKHIVNTPERDFRIKISGLEIYNENVRDLLNSESSRNLKLLDDPEKGTVVEKLVEETASNDQHLRQLISICESQRQVGETALNDTSSRSHQIIRLTIESTLRESSGCVKSFTASLNFVDLAGSERASQTHADGARLREGCHINLSLMTLTTVIRKLSVGKRSGHIPYRDSKLTRILQHSLGGNARTAIICTLSPASSHVEQSRNTLFFATRAKEVTNNAQVNMVVSDKQLVRHLQKEVARLAAELKTPDPSREKDLKIQQMEAEIQELRSQKEELQRKLQDVQRNSNVSESPPHTVKKCLSYSGALPPHLDGKELIMGNKSRNMMERQPIRQSSTAPFALMNEIRKLEHLQEQLGEEANRALEVLQKEVACHRLGNQDAAETIAKLQVEIREMRSVKTSTKKGIDIGGAMVATNKSVSANLKDEITKLHSQGSTIANLEEQLENVQKSIDKLVMSLPSSFQPIDREGTLKTKTHSNKKKLSPLACSNSGNLQNLIRSPCSPLSAARQIVDSDTENQATNKSVSANLKDEITKLHSQGSTIANLEEQLENVQKSIDKLVMSLPSSFQPIDREGTLKTKTHSNKKKLSPLACSNSGNLQNLIRSPCSPLSAARQIVDSDTENQAPENNIVTNNEIMQELEKQTPGKSDDGSDIPSKDGTPPCHQRTSSVNMKKMQKMFQNAAEENVRSIRAYVTELKERVAKLQYQKQLLVCQVLELEANEAAGYDIEDDNMSCPDETHVSWHISFRDQRQQIIELWDVCYISIIHRTQFYLLFKGEPADQIYMEVELRRLTWLQQHLAEIGNASPAPTSDESIISLNTSLRALRREREFLAKRLKIRLSPDEIEALYMKWDVPLEGKQRRMQFVNRLWTNPHDEKHIQESAEIVAKLVGFSEGSNVSKEMFELNFAAPSDKRAWIMGWTDPISNLLHF